MFHRVGWFAAGAALLLLGAIAGCGSGGFVEPGETVIIPYTEAEQQMRQEAQNASYRLKPGDQFGVVFAYEPDLNQRGIFVMPDGRISAVGVENVMAAGLTVVDLDALLTEEFGRVYEHPDLSIVVETLGTAQVYVLGEVRIPGEVDLKPGGMGVLQAITQGGGFTDDAAKSETVVIRATDQGYQYRRLDLSKIDKGGLAGVANMDLQPYDIIYVPRSAIGDFDYFNKTVLAGVLNFSRLFWDIYAIVNLDKVDRILR
ncbi:MAG TPA: polysaccharide biosynthesis/export family protein [Candidatus Krumholzibacteria bacterium]|nr:polysaccharide biosynthesis/export family protein [Candidatus Krumholzibacteria bacterium]HRX51235.1 polysaccharide biosynthesis/export family protein [Candidatus Krumholzibacteria bacterium]